MAVSMATREKNLPYDQDAEESLIGSVLIDDSVFGELRLSVSDFFVERCRIIWAAMKALWARRVAIDQVTLGTELGAKLDDCGGPAYLSHLISLVPTTLNAEHYAESVRRLSAARQAIDLARHVEAIGYEARADTTDAASEIVKLAQQYRLSYAKTDEIISPMQAGEMVSKIYEEGVGHPIMWGFKSLDETMAGVYPGEMVIIGGRPQVGKTQIMLDIAEGIAQSDKALLFVSAEMTMRAILERAISRHLRIGIRDIRQFGIKEELQDKLIDLAGRVSARPMYYLPRGVSSDDIYAASQRMKESVGLDIVFVDYLGKLRDAESGRGENMNIRIGHVCSVLKDIAVDLNVPVVVACQLNRGLEYRDDKRPMLADLRDSGNIEQDADVVLLLHRDPESPQILEVMMAKHRQLGASRQPCLLFWSKDDHKYGDEQK